MDLFKRPIVIAIVFAAIFIAIIWSYVEKRRETAKTSPPVATEAVPLVNLTNVDPTDFDTIIKDELAASTNKAGEIGSNWLLGVAEITLPGDLLPNTGTSRYIFSNSSDETNNWMITFSQNSGQYIRALVPKADYLGDITPINVNLWKFNYVTALQIAEKSGGQTWREGKQIANVVLVLRHSSPNNWLLWSVTYTSLDKQTLIVKIDANSGQIITEK